MAQFDFYRYGSGFLLDAQADLMDGLNTRVCVPLVSLEEAPKPARRLNPVFRIGAGQYVMLTQFMASVPLSELADKAGALAHEHDVIKAAIDMVFDGV